MIKQLCKKYSALCEHQKLRSLLWGAGVQKSPPIYKHNLMWPKQQNNMNMLTYFYLLGSLIETEASLFQPGRNQLSRRNTNNVGIVLISFLDHKLVI